MAKLPRIVALLAGATFVLFGLYAFAAPKAFFDALATFEPYNRHFIHDIGSFQIGIGAALILAVYVRDGLMATLAGASIGQAFHFISHLMDKDLGEKQATTIPFLAIVTGLLITAAFARARERN